MRCFRCLAGDQAYEQARLVLDAAWGHPTPDGLTLTCIEPAATAPRDPQGRIAPRAMCAVKEGSMQYAPKPTTA